MHHDDKLWDQPMKFWPERFFDKNNQKLGEELYQFGLGKVRVIDAYFFSFMDNSFE